MNKEYLREPQFTKQSILQNVFAPHHFDGTKASDDLSLLVSEEHRRRSAQNMIYPSVGGALFSLYNVTRIGQLSPTGKPAAILGTVFFTYLTLACASQSRSVGAALPIILQQQAPVEEQKQGQQ